MSQKVIEVCFTPAIYPLHHKPDAIVVIVDILRATSAISAAFMNGVKEIIPVKEIDVAKEYKEKGYLVAAERDGYVLDFADFGNSPYNFTRERVEGRSIVYSTTNGTKAIELARGCSQIVVGSYLNLSALSRWLIDQNKDVTIFCAGWKNRFSLEDAVFSGAISQKLIDAGQFITICDSANAALDLWNVAKDDLIKYSQKVAQKGRLASKGLDDVFDFCHEIDKTDVIPILFVDRLLGVTSGR